MRPRQYPEAQLLSGPRAGLSRRAARAGGTAGVVLELALLCLSALLYALCFPSFLSDWGWFPLAYIALVPLFIVVHRSSWPRIFLYGLFFGFLSYGLYNFWLGKFHPLALFIVPPIYAGYFLLLMPLLKAADALFPRYGFILQTLLWVAYEYFKTLGFLGYPYGIIGYSQYLFLPLIRLAGLTGVWGVSLLVVFPSTLLGNALKQGRRIFFPFLKQMAAPALCYLLAFASSLVYGALAAEELSGARPWKVALVQQNVDPWKGGAKAYENSLNISTRLSVQASLQDPEIIIWSETAFVPSVDWHTRYRTDRELYTLVKRLREFLSTRPEPYLIGNNDGQLALTDRGEEVRIDYNATLLLQRGRILGTYRKLHLVPFTENFPYQDVLPGIDRWLRHADTHFWEKGREYTVFEAGGVKFSTPICFEDTFGYLCRGFIRHGAEVLVNMTNDSWSNSVACAMQHLSAAVFRAVENKRSLVRATNGGITCVIDPNGRIVSRLAPFSEGALIATVPVFTGTATPYTRWGDWLGQGLLILGPLGLLAGAARSVLRRKED